MTVQELISRSLRILRVQDSHEAPEAEDYATAMLALNSMLTRWEADGVALGWQNVDNPEDVLPVPDEAQDAVAYNLALRLRSEYGASIDPDVIQFARDGLNALYRDVKVASPLTWNRGGRFYDIYTDEYR